jgi:signal transduction histidine kinase
VIGRTSRQLGLWLDDSRKALLAAIRDEGSVYQRETAIVDKAGRRVPVQFSGERIELDGQSVLLATVRDITERKLAAEQRELLIRELEAKNTELERFTYSASHDLRSPLVTILGFLGLVGKDVETGDRAQADRDLERIRAAANHMRRLLDELLELSRVGRVVRPSQVLSLNSVAEEAVALPQRALTERGIDLRLAPGLPVVSGDRTRLLQVFQNLLENAVRFLGDQPRPRIVIGCRRDGDEDVCYVRDNGIGIDPGHHDAVFELFRRLQPSIEGTGVGLALVRRIVEGHGGRIWVESEGAGRGSSFCFVLPAGSPP